MSELPLELDVGPDLRAGREPFARIMAAVDGLHPGQALLLRAPIEPTPLLAVMRGRGFAARVTMQADGTVEVRFTPIPGVPRGPAPSTHPACPACPGRGAADAPPAAR